MKKLFPFALGWAFTALSFNSQAQTAPFTTDNYQKALWMTTRMYGGQRSGDNNWYVYNHLPNKLWTNPPVPIAEKYRGRNFFEDNDAGYDLSGGWHDCGDHVKFGQTEFYSAYVLLKGYAEFPLGYDDHYSQNYKSYKATGKWNWEEDGHESDGVPDVVNEVKHATDFFIKCAKDANTFYYQVGGGDEDHKVWATSVLQQTMRKDEGGQPRVAHKNPKDASMPSFCGATLALMSRVYKSYNPKYADSCLAAAKNAYAYAKKQNGTIPSPDGPPYYPANADWKDDFVTMCSELFWATGEEKYKTEALSFSIGKTKGQGDVYGNPGYAFCYNDNGDIALYNLALLDKPMAASILNSIVEDYQKVVDNNGLFNQRGMDWGPLRYNANVAWITALNLKLKKQNNTVPKFIYDQIDYILGKNSSNQSYIVGFGAKSPNYPHNRDIFCADRGDDKNPGIIPAKNKQSGLLVGGTRDPGQFKDSPSPEGFKLTEGGIDYNAGLVGSLGYINSVRKPVDQSKFPAFVNINQLTAVRDVEEFASRISVFPNPSVHNFTVATQYNLTLKVYDNLGHLVKSMTTGEGEAFFGEELLPGVYHLNFLIGSNLVKSMNVVKNW